MKIAVIQASTQTARNKLIFEETKRAVAAKNWEVFNFGVHENEDNFSYIQISLCVGLLLNSAAVDFVVTGCSSGNVWRLLQIAYQMSSVAIYQHLQMHICLDESIREIVSRFHWV